MHKEGVRTDAELDGGGNVTSVDDFVCNRVIEEENEGRIGVFIMKNVVDRQVRGFFVSRGGWFYDDRLPK